MNLEKEFSIDEEKPLWKYLIGTLFLFGVFYISFEIIYYWSLRKMFTGLVLTHILTLLILGTFYFLLKRRLILIDDSDTVIAKYYFFNIKIFHLVFSGIEYISIFYSKYSSCYEVKMWYNNNSSNKIVSSFKQKDDAMILGKKIADKLKIDLKDKS